MVLDPTQEFLNKNKTLPRNKTFRFDCNLEVSCLNSCCRAMNLPLTPYDVLNLRRGLDASLEELVRNHCKFLFSPNTGFPEVRLRMLPDELENCPFAGDNGCTVYEHRPAVCRYYPLGRALTRDLDGELLERFFLARESHCDGFDADREWTPESWVVGQGLEKYNYFNDMLFRLMVGIKDLKIRVSEKQAGMIYLALYNLENFRGFIDAMKIFNKVDITRQRREAVMQNDEALLEFGYEWLNLLLIGASESLRPKIRKPN